MMLAKRKGPCLPQDMLLAFRAASRECTHFDERTNTKPIIEFDEEKMTRWQKLTLF